MLQSPSCPRLLYVFALFGMLLLSGCMSATSLRPTHADDVLGTPRYYYQAQEVVYQTAQDVLRDFGLQVVETAPDQSYLLAQRGLTVLDWGIVVGVYVGPMIDQVTRVIIRTDPKFAANIATQDVTSLLHADLRKRLSGQ